MSVQPTSEAQLGDVVSNECTKGCRVVTTSHVIISVYYERYERGHRRDRFRMYKELCCQGRLMGSA
jgi:hypothetical protein